MISTVIGALRYSGARLRRTESRCYRGGDYAVPKQAHERGAIAQGIGKVLNDLFASVVKEPVPERWVDLINRLNEEERKKAVAEQTPTQH